MRKESEETYEQSSYPRPIHALTLTADLPDVKIDHIDVRVEHQTLTLRRQRKFEKEENIKGYHRIERSYGEFVRSFAVPSTVDTEKVEAD